LDEQRHQFRGLEGFARTAGQGNISNGTHHSITGYLADQVEKEKRDDQ
jgi:hypothetical protein